MKSEMVKEHKVATGIFVLSLFGAIGLGIVVLRGIIQENWCTDVAICALGATAFTSLFEALGSKK